MTCKDYTMKSTRNAPQNRGYRLTPTAVRVLEEERTPQHFFYSEKLGKCRAIIITDAENLPRPTAQTHRQMVEEIIDEFEQEQAAEELSKGDKLAILMNCSDRLHKRWLAAWEAHQALPVYDVRLNAAFAKLKRITSASSRLTKKIADMLGENDSR
jgi:hypothetical protein